MALVFTAHDFADGAEIITQTLNKQKIKASFFFTGDFYRNFSFAKSIRQLKKDRHYLGAHSDKHLLYADWGKRDSLLVTQEQFRKDLEGNYNEMARFGITKKDAPFFLPPYEWYNKTVSQWTTGYGLTLVNFSNGTRSTADYTWPEMGKSYRSSDEIYQSIIDYEGSSDKGMNGFILLIHFGTDPRRKDKFYNRLDELITDLKGKGYNFKRIDELLQ